MLRSLFALVVFSLLVARGAPPPLARSAPLLSVAGLAAPPVAAGQRGAAGDAPSQQPVFTATANYVSRDVTVVDSQGRFVSDLDRRDFRVFEDGVEQKIEWFAKMAGGRVLADEGPARLRPEGVILPAGRRADVVGRVFVIFVDDMHVQPLDTPATRRLLERMRDTLIKDDDLIAIVSTGYSSIAVDLGYDYGHGRLTRAIGKVMGSGQTPQAIIQAPSTAGGPAALRYGAQVAFRTALDILERLATVTNRRKAFIYVSSGYDFDPFQDARLKEERFWRLPNGEGASIDDPFRAKSDFSEADLVNQLAELIRAAIRTNTTFHTVDPRGLVAGPPIETRLSFEDWRAFVQKTTGSLRVLASETGGRAGVDRNDFDRFFREVDAAMSDYYVIGYYSSNDDRSRRTRQVEITADRPGVGLRYQREYSISTR
jgi:VWFA-related protein